MAHVYEISYADGGIKEPPEHQVYRCVLKLPFERGFVGMDPADVADSLMMRTLPAGAARPGLRTLHCMSVLHRRGSKFTSVG